MAGILTNGDMTTDDGVTHTAPAARVYDLYVNTVLQYADLRMYYYHNLTALGNKANPIKIASYHFTVGGIHPYEDIVIPGQNAQANFFNYIKSLPEFSGWTEI